ncbi:MAG TPA: DUF4124 domain-containing protein [Moraxellaceae bacterium]|nr:DUF4124 domain-containing protein [Moraxellaceae bacterium]
MKTATYCLAVLALALGASTAEAAKFYKWTDAEGVTHYSADPPPEGKAKASEIRVKTAPAADSTQASDTTAGSQDGKAKGADASKDKSKDKAKGDKKSDDQSAKAAGKEPAKYAEKCKQLHSDLDTLQEHTRVRQRDATTGEERFMTDDEKSSRLDDTQRQIKAYCE